eukprot:NODE_13_length_54415_cov_0.522424.p20 type:complete len:317 gc:universal NODE_13_length_54415_cov_0.522424:19350-20300(+)
MNFATVLPIIDKCLWRKYLIRTTEKDLLFYLDKVQYKFQCIDALKYLTEEKNLKNSEQPETLVILNSDVMNHDDFDLSYFMNQLADKIILFTNECSKKVKFDIECSLRPAKKLYDDICVHERSMFFTLLEWANLCANSGSVENEISKKEKQLINFQKPICHHPCTKRLGKILDYNLNSNSKFPLPKGCLLHGRTGSGKSQIAKQLCYTAGYYAIFVYCTELYCKYVGESEAKLRDLFADARQMQPTILVFDEFEAISKVRGTENVDDRMLTCLLTELDGVQERGDIFVVACVRDISKVDSALKRPGRFDLLIDVEK